MTYRNPLQLTPARKRQGKPSKHLGCTQAWAWTKELRDVTARSTWNLRRQAELEQHKQNMVTQNVY